MNEKINSGGPAFPVQYSNEADGPTVMPSEGITLRDYFAAKAMQGMAGSHAYCERGWDQADLAGQAYEIADAMLKAREVK